MVGYIVRKNCKISLVSTLVSYLYFSHFIKVKTPHRATKPLGLITLCGALKTGQTRWPLGKPNLNKLRFLVKWITKKRKTPLVKSAFLFLFIHTRSLALGRPTTCGRRLCYPALVITPTPFAVFATSSCSDRNLATAKTLCLNLGLYFNSSSSLKSFQYPSKSHLCITQ